MNNPYEQEIRYNLIKILSQETNLTQRDMAKKMGISLGKANYCISELAKKGFIKINRFKVSNNKIRYFYILTPRGVEEKARLTLSFLKRKVSEYEEMKHQIRKLALEVEENRLTGILETETLDVMQRIP
ncbi:MAG: MarR family EPS-associated transcriptional regulator [Desulfobacteraceae bacterium]|nr:MarR family EPS-associated transcriptional regulator [Desulfobacteraceae bacterium]